MVLSKQEFSHLAKVGAQARLEELERERELILKTFPDLSSSSSTAPRPSTPKRRSLTPEQRKAIAERMKRYWKGRRKGSAKK